MLYFHKTAWADGSDEPPPSLSFESLLTLLLITTLKPIKINCSNTTDNIPKLIFLNRNSRYRIRSKSLRSNFFIRLSVAFS